MIMYYLLFIAQEFIVVREGVERERKAELKRQAAASAAANANTGDSKAIKPIPRRHNSMISTVKVDAPEVVETTESIPSDSTTTVEPVKLDRTAMLQDLLAKSGGLTSTRRSSVT
jgi:hypothetical protein